ncbi:unnamed protein product [Blepharisma stoltei]|uniref:FCP1 homology domain-containing protein n=1 Tax=Blepharisma stoltei TaxID=1481888 RepID=A0AAU9KF88_9CILI|nr:unnamed protein product [Blepharisma stoltei]
MEIDNQEQFNLVKSAGCDLITSARFSEASQTVYQIQTCKNIPCGINCENVEVEIEDDSQTMDTETEPEDIPSQSFVAEEQQPLSIKPLLPMKTRRTHRQTLVLDLDETLVHSEIKPFSTANLIVNIFYQDRPCSIYVSFRPGLFRFLEAVSQRFEVVLFTASHKCYAEQVLKFIDPDMKLMKYRLYRENCAESNGVFLKDLRMLGRDLREVIIVDNSVQAFSLQPDNGIPISSWYNDMMDRELYRTVEILDELQRVGDVREVLHQKFNISNNLIN